MALSAKTKLIMAFVSAICLAVIIVSIALSQSKGNSVSSFALQASLHNLECVVSEDDKNECEKVGCVWNERKNDGSPNCLLPEEHFGYNFIKYDSDSNVVELKVKKGSFFGSDFKKVQLKIIHVNKNVLRIKFEDAEQPRYEVPVGLNLDSKSSEGDPLYNVSFSTNPNELFNFKVTRTDTDTIIFDSRAGSLFLADHHIEITTKLASENVYGIGENTHQTFRHDFNYVKWPLFSRDQPPKTDVGNGKLNLYGVHPFYTCLEKSGKSHGVLFFNSNAMEMFLTPSQTLTFRSSGGILDIFFFIGDNPEHTVQMYTDVIGRPMIPPYWSLGFQLSRYGFNSLDNMKAAIKRTKDKNIPLDVVHADIDHMENNKDFTWDQQRFKGFDQFVVEQKKDGLRTIIILDPALLANDITYREYTEGEDKDVYVKWPSDIKKEDRQNPEGVNTDKDIMYGKVWPLGPVAFPDYFKPVTTDWWKKCIEDYRKIIQFDALWIDMNEPAAFGTDDKNPWYCPGNDTKCWSLKCPNNHFDNMKNTFIPAAASIYGKDKKLSDKTLCMAAIQGDNGKYVHFDVHSLYGWSQTESTYTALQNSATADQVPLVISRSTYPSSGRFSGHWLGDNHSKWQDLRASIIGTLEFNLFGIPYVGADICGFFYNTTSELCGRWMQLGAFYPFSRNHNSYEAIDQDPGNEKIMLPNDIARSRNAMNTRYQLLPYLHTLHYIAHKYGNTVVRPLFHEFPLDNVTYTLQEQFLWGPALLIMPALYQGQNNITAYLPGGFWYDFYEGNAVPEPNGHWITIEDTEKVPLHVRGGHILPLKEAGALNTQQSRQKDFEIRVYPKDSKATGDLFWMVEEAKSQDNPETFSTFQFTLESNKLTIKAVWSGKLERNHMTIGRIVLYDVPLEPKSVKYDNKVIPETEYIYNQEKKVLQVTKKINLLDLNSNEPTKTSKTLEWEF